MVGSWVGLGGPRMRKVAFVLTPLLGGVIIYGIAEGKTWWEILAMSLGAGSLILALYGVA